MGKSSTALPLFSDDLKRNLLERLKKVEGQVRGVQRMLDEDQPCHQVLNQLAATATALHGVSTLVLRNYLERCVSDSIESGDSRRKRAALDDLMEVFKRFGQ
jgi:DNA-binding FrmR family transcriptional regulator